jgi:hypothetical protein
LIRTLQSIFEKALEQLSYTLTAYVPPVLAGLTILAVAWVIAALVRWFLIRIFKGVAFDRFLHQTGLTSLIDRSDRLHGTRLVSGAAYWIIVGLGLLTALSAFNTQLSSRIIEGVVLLLPKIVAAAAILVAGAWVGQYLGRSVLVWAFNENVPWARHIASLVRVGIMFVAVVAAADHLGFARSVFLAAFIVVAGGVVLAAAIAGGLVGRTALQRQIDERKEAATGVEERSLWTHL